jgi:acyl transferase domain-containing protein
MNKAELIEAIKAKGFVAIVVNEDAKNAELEALLDALEASSHVDELTSKVVDLEATITKKEEEAAELVKSLEELNAQLAESEKTPVSSKDVIAIFEKKKYVVQSGAVILIEGEAKNFTKEEIAQSKEAIAILLKTESSILKPVE